MDSFLSDARYGVRTLTKAPAFTAVVLLTLALGIGANTAIFSIVNAVLLRPLPYPESFELVHVSWRWNRQNPGPGAGFSAFKADYWMRNARGFEGLAAFTSTSHDVAGEGLPEHVPGLGVSAGFFDVLGVEPARGRSFLPEEDVPNGPRVALIGHGLWQRRFGEEDLLGGQVTLDGVEHTVVGVLPPDFAFETGVRAFGAVDVVTPLQLSPDPGDPAHNHPLLGRLADGTTLAEARAGMQALLERFAEEVPGGGVSLESNGIGVLSLHEVVVGDVEQRLWVLLGAVGFVLLIACANVANLMLSRSASRQREIALRATLGASRGRLTTQLLTESVTLALAGGALALLVAFWTLDAFIARVPASTPRLQEVGLDGTVLLFTLGASLVTGLLFGLGSAVRVSDSRLPEILKEGGRGSAEPAGGPFARRALVVVEVALSLVLLVGAGILIASFAGLRSVDPGFEARGLVAVEMTLPSSRYPTPEAGADFNRRVMGRVRSLPGVESVAAVSSTPLERGLNNMAGFEGSEERMLIEYRPVSPGYFGTLGAPVLRGREFDDTDTAASRPVTVVNEAFARQAWPGEDALGRLVVAGARMGNLEGPAREVVGVVADTRELGLDQPAPPTVFVPQPQVPAPVYSMIYGAFPHVLLVRGEISGELTEELRRQVAAVDPVTAVHEIRSLEQVIADITETPRFQGWLMGSFAALALLLTLVGLYGLISYAVSQRTREIGLRMALGAEASGVLRMVLGQGMRLVALGLVLGLGGAIALAGYLESLVFEISPLDPRIYAVVVVLLGLVALAACAVPALRATRVDPLVALRAE